MQTAAQDLEKQSPTTPKDSEIVRQCAWCLADVRLKPTDPRVRALDVTCPTCEEKQSKRLEDEKRMARGLRIAGALNKIPAAFRGTSRDLLPRPDCYDAMMRWQFGPKGLVMFGSTGLGKSRCAWALAERELKAGRDVEPIDALALTRYPALLMSDLDAADKLLRRLATCELLLLDDPFKVKPTERVEELVFLSIDQRMQWDRPIIATLNDTGDTLLARLSPDRGPALIRRLREACSALNFNESP